MAVEITSREELEAWLKGKPREWAQVIAVRSALRVVPFACYPSNWEDESRQSKLILSVFRAMAVSLAAAKIPADDTVRYAADAA